MYDDIAKHLAECDAKLQALLGELGQRKVDLGKAPRAGSKSRTGVRCPSDPGQLGRRGPYAHQFGRKGSHSQQVVCQREQQRHALDLGQTAHGHALQAVIACLRVHAFSGRCAALVDLAGSVAVHALAPLRHRCAVPRLGLELTGCSGRLRGRFHLVGLAVEFALGRVLGLVLGLG